MPPHGRRRFSTTSVILSFLFLFAYTASAASAVLGIDFGTEHIKAALVKPGIPLEIVLTKDSKRKESAAVGFKPGKRTASTEAAVFPERLYGGDALAVAARFPGDVYSNLKPLLGQIYASNDLIETYKQRYPGLSIVEDKHRGTTGIKSPSFEQGEDAFLVEELLAMELKNIKKNAQVLAGKHINVRDAVITIPPFYTAEEKAAVTLAAELAGVRLLALIDDGLAVGLDYAKSRTFPNLSEGEKPEVHLVYDMGAGSTTATIIKFNGRTVKDVGKYNKTIQELHVLGTGWDRTLGGDALNQLIVDDMVTKFVHMDKMQELGFKEKQVKEQPKAMARLWKEAERIRQVLSANSETFATLEGFYHEDVNYKYKLSRADFEKMAAPHSGRVKEPISVALASAKLTINDIDSVILFGGAARTPFVQKQLENAAGSAEKLKTNVNSDEAAVFGAAFKAATISPSFRVKEIRTSDGASYAVGMTWTQDGTSMEQPLFPTNSEVGIVKPVHFSRTQDFTFTFHEEIPGKAGEMIDKPVTKVQILNMTASADKLVEKFHCAKADIDTVFEIRLSPVNGLPEVVKGSVSCETTAPKGVLDGLKDVFGFGGKKDEQKPIVSDEEDDSSSADRAGSSSTSTSASDSQSSGTSTSEAEKAEETPKEEKKRIEIIYLDFSSDLVGLPSPNIEQMQRLQDRLAAFDSSDRLRVKREETLNSLEAFTYKARDLLDDEGFIEASTQSMRDTITEKFKSASEWLYGDGVDASRDELKSRLEELHSLVDPVQKRKEETQARPEAVKALKEALNQTKTMVEVVQGQINGMADLSKSTTATESETPVTTESASSTDEFASLEDSTTSSTVTDETPPPPPPMFAYSQEDLKNLTESMASTEEWLEAKLAEQDKLLPSDEPVVKASEMSAKAKEMNDMMMNLLTKSMKTPPKPKKPRANASKSATVKSKKAGSSTTMADPISSSTPDVESSAGEGSSSTSSKKQTTKPTMKSKSKSKAQSKKTKTKSANKTKATPKEEL